MYGYGYSAAGRTGRRRARDVAAWVARTEAGVRPLLDMDFQHGRYWFDGSLRGWAELVTLLDVVGTPNFSDGGLAIASAADTLTIGPPDGPPLPGFNAAEGTAIVTVQEPAGRTTGVYFSFDDGSLTQRFTMSRATAVDSWVIVQNGGSLTLAATVANAPGLPATFALAMREDDFRWAANGVLAGSDDSGPVPSGLKRLTLGNRGGSSDQFVGVIRRFTYFPTRLADADLGRLSVAPDTIAVWGDSLGAALAPYLPAAFSPDRSVHNGGAGDETSSEIRARVIADTIRRGKATVLWAGRNNFGAPQTVKADIAAMVAHVGHGRFVVLSVLNGDYPDEHAGGPGHAALLQLNADLAALYRGNYLDVRSMLAAGDPDDIPAAAYRADSVHLNAAGNMVVAEAVAELFAARGW